MPNKVFIMISFLKWPINFFPKIYLKFKNFPNDKKKCMIAKGKKYLVF